MLYAILLSLRYAYICMCILLILRLLSYVICHVCVFMFLKVCVVTVFYVGKKLYRAYACNVTL